MLDDLVIDTNVLLHADDPRQKHQADAYALLQKILSGGPDLCVDDGFDIDPARNQSLIGGEYLERLAGASTGSQFLAHLFSTDRIRFVPRKVPRAVKQSIEQCVRNKRDRTFLAVAHNAVEHVLCSQDFVDMSAKKRKHLGAVARVAVLQVADVQTRI